MRVHPEATIGWYYALPICSHYKWEITNCLDVPNHQYATIIAINLLGIISTSIYLVVFEMMVEDG